MDKKLAFVSSADARYFPILIEWIQSLREFPQCAGTAICIMDVGLTPEQVEKIRPLVTTVKKIDWPFPLPARRIRGREYLKACLARPFIPQNFPGYETYIWMDADTWVQDWSAVELYLQGASKNKLAIAGQVDRAYPRQIRIKWLGQLPWKVRNFYFSNARKAFGFKTARILLDQHVLQAGVFALRYDAPHWKRWQELVIKAVKKGKLFTAEQMTLGVLCYIEKYDFELLPAWANWLCEHKPLVDDETGLFVEPYLPHLPIGILHMSGWDDMRLNRALTTDFKTLAGKTVERPFRYPGFDGEAG